jgi:ABC-type glutathione transport system ATPase component
MNGPLLAVDRLTLSYARAGRTTLAVDEVSLAVKRGEVLAVVGESGSGKSSLARCIVGLAHPDSGTIELEGSPLGRRRAKEQRRRVQMVFQDPRSALDPRMSVFALLDEGWRTHPSTAPADRRGEAGRLLQSVGLGPELLDRRPSQISGGQAQRVSIARALAVGPELLVCDEAVSALDVSVQTQVLALLAEIRERLQLTMLFITHDLGVVRRIADRVAVMHRGRVVETGTVDDVFRAPTQEYTRELLSAALDLSTTLPDH